VYDTFIDMMGTNSVLHACESGMQMAESGSVLFNFNRQGEVVVTGVTEDEAFTVAMDSGADDVVPVESEEEDGQECYKIVMQAPDYAAVRDKVVGMGLDVQEDRSGLVYQPMAMIEIEDDEQHRANEELYDKCLQIDDVDAIFTTCADVGRNKSA
jgi:transcriptional/translational regulatory protein YebC/TACO1